MDTRRSRGEILSRRQSGRRCGDGNDALYGGNGADSLEGLDGDDKRYGGAGSDGQTGDKGRTVLTAVPATTG